MVFSQPPGPVDHRILSVNKFITAFITTAELHKAQCYRGYIPAWPGAGEQIHSIRIANDPRTVMAACHMEISGLLLQGVLRVAEIV
jgi:hypothetical protein